MSNRWRKDVVYYHGCRRPFRVWKTVADTSSQDLTPAASQALINHSPDGFEWGYQGSGPAQLALAILLDFTRDPELADRYHQMFKSEVVAKWISPNWMLPAIDVYRWLELHRTQTCPQCNSITRGGA
jgi:hypothetical protein